MNPIRNYLPGALVVVFLIGFPMPARADAAIPMMPVRYPEILLSLIPVILIETIYLYRHLNTNVRRTFVAVAGINIITTGVGYPLTFALYVGLDELMHFPQGIGQAFNHIGWVPMWMAGQLFPEWSGLQQSVWVMLGMFVLLLLPGYVLSGFIKTWLLHGYDLLKVRGSIKGSVWMATRLSYLFLATAGCIILYLIYAQQSLPPNT